MTTPAGHDDELTLPSAPGRASRAVERASIAVFAVFFLNGFNFASWAARLPAIRDGLDFSPAQMGAAAPRRLGRLAPRRCRCPGWWSSASVPAARCSRSRSSTPRA